MLYLFIYLQAPNNEFDFFETNINQYVDIDPEGVIRVKADLTSAQNTFQVC